jgi:cysteine desulfurase
VTCAWIGRCKADICPPETPTRRALRNRRTDPSKLSLERAYFDWNATAELRPDARAAMLAAMDAGGNASSVHAEGRRARQSIEAARAQVASLVGVRTSQVVFTSGATEANMLALAPSLQVSGTTRSCDRLFVSAIEHPSVLCGGRFHSDAMQKISIGPHGAVALDALKRALAGTRQPLVSVMLANNETGAVQPIRAVADIVHAAGGLLHVDAVQAAGRIPLDMTALGADMLSLSSHKLGGPQGAGALIRTPAVSPEALIRGGGQERGFRAGTENVAAIAGFGAAAEAARAGLSTEPARMRTLRDRIEAEIRALTPDAVIFGIGAERLPNTSLIAVPGLKAEIAVIAFDLNGIALSSGAACSSGKVQPSHVLAAMGVDADLARAALRVSLGPTTGEADVERLLNAWKRVVSSLRKEQRGFAA